MIIKYYNKNYQIVKTTIGFIVPNIITIKEIEYGEIVVRNKKGIYLKTKKMYNKGKVNWVGLTRYVQLQEYIGE